jgi:hypothetical protein
MGQHRQPRTRDDVGARQQLFNHRPHGGGAEHQGFLATAAVQHAIGEDVSALEIGGELHLVDGNEGGVEVPWHGLDGRDPEARIGRLDLFFPGDQRDRLCTDALRHLAIDFARQQPQGQTDHAGRMRQHAFDREVRLAGIGWAEHRRHACTACAGIAPAGGRKRNCHQ